MSKKYQAKMHSDSSPRKGVKSMEDPCNLHTASASCELWLLVLPDWRLQSNTDIHKHAE